MPTTTWEWTIRWTDAAGHKQECREHTFVDAVKAAVLIADEAERGTVYLVSDKRTLVLVNGEPVAHHPYAMGCGKKARK